MAKSGLRLRLEIHGDGEAVDHIKRIGTRARDAKPVLAVIQGLMEAKAREIFESKGGQLGESWKPDKEETIEKKKAKGFPADIEVETGALRDSLFGESHDTIRRLSRSSTTYGTRKFYAVFQGHERRLLGITLREADLWSEKMVEWILSGKVR